MSTHTVHVGEVERSGRGEVGEGGRQRRGLGEGGRKGREVRGIEGKWLERKEGEGGGGAHCYTALSTHKFTLARKWCESSVSYIGAMYECFDAHVHNLRVPQQNDLRYDLPGRSLGHCTHLCFGSSDIPRKILFYYKFYLQVSRDYS